MASVSSQHRGLKMDGQLMIVAGGSKGVGRELAKELVSRGANVVIIARGIEALNQTKETLLAMCTRPNQWVDAHAVDLANAEEVEALVASFQELPSALFCVAGGTAEEVGFFAEITTGQIQSCLNNNYFSSAFITHALLRRWLKQPASDRRSRHVVFTASAATFVALPGYSAYTPAKTALRALADTLRAEMLMYRPAHDIRIHCSFPGTIFTEIFSEEQKRKPALCKELEGSDDPANGMTPEAVVQAILAGLERDQYFITMDLTTKLLLNNMRGPSPRDSPIWDWIMGLAASLIWPFYRVKFDQKTLGYCGQGSELSSIELRSRN